MPLFLPVSPISWQPVELPSFSFLNALWGIKNLLLSQKATTYRRYRTKNFFSFPKPHTYIALTSERIPGSLNKTECDSREVVSRKVTLRRMNARTRKNKIPDIIPESSGETNQDITGIEHKVKGQAMKLRKHASEMLGIPFPILLTVTPTLHHARTPRTQYYRNT